MRTAFLGRKERKTEAETDPGNGKQIGTLPEMGLDDVKLAVDNAHAAFATWGKTTEYERHAILIKLFKSATPSPTQKAGILITFVDFCRRTTKISLRCDRFYEFRGVVNLRSTVQIITVENGKPIVDARGEVTYGCTSIHARSSN